MPRLRVVLVEDDSQFLDNVLTLLAGADDTEVVGSYLTGQSGLTGVVETQPDVAVIDLGLPDMSGVKVIAEIKAQGCPTECIVLSAFDDDAHLFAALKAGAVGYIVKSEVSRAELAQRLREVSSGGAPMSQGIARRILQEFREPVKPARNTRLRELSARELEVLQYQAQGFTARKIAQQLFISYETVRSHQKTIYKKLQVHSLAEAVAVLQGEKG